jgi:methane/ammonia monooxygenase subunit C
MAEAVAVGAERAEGGVTGRDWLVTLGVVLGVLMAAAVVLRGYQQLFAWTAGLDSSTPEFATYWMSLFWAEIASVSALAMVWWSWAAFTKCRTCEAQRAAVGSVKPGHELRHLAMLWISTTVATFSAFMQLAFFGEQDATWHQVAIRDTAFTPSHIPLFYFWFPLLITASVGSFLYARTRLPHIYRDRGYPLSLLLVIAGTALLLMHVSVNEYIHSFWQTEEIFSHPAHWPFVLYFYVAAAVFSVWFQTLPRIYELIGQARQESQGRGGSQ